MEINAILDNEPKVIKTDEGSIDGQNKCPKCGSTDISLNSKTGLLRCNFVDMNLNQKKFKEWKQILVN